MSYLNHIEFCNQHNLDHFLPFLVEGVTVGHLHHNLAVQLSKHPQIFIEKQKGVTFVDSLTNFDNRSLAIRHIVDILAQDRVIPPVRGELYPVAVNFFDDPYFQLDRSAVAAFGIRSFGVHVNGFVRNPDGTLNMWIARRAQDRMSYPGMLDNMVAGGQPIGLGLKENVIKECAEEAAIPASIANGALSTGAISYVYEAKDGLKPDIMFCYDLELPENFAPQNTDGEVETFYLMSLMEVAEIVESSFEFKFNCNLVIIDFLIRHGILSPEHPDYVKLIRGLHQ